MTAYLSIFTFIHLDSNFYQDTFIDMKLPESIIAILFDFEFCLKKLLYKEVTFQASTMHVL